ncbi:MAG: lytic transglycosylase domain-containing protein [Polyangiales bacterium]
MRPSFPRTILLGLGLLLGSADGVARADDPLAAAAARVERRDVEGALRELGRAPDAARSSPRGLYLRAFLEERSGVYERAAASYGEALAAGLPNEIASRAMLRRATLLARTGHCRDARPTLVERGRLRDREAPVARALAAECALELGEREAALRELEAVVREDAGPVDGVAARLAYASALARWGDRARAVALLRETYLARPAHRDVALVEAALRALDPASLRLGREERLARAERLSDAGRHDLALEELDALGRPREAAALAAYQHLRGTILLATRERAEEAASAFAEAARVGGARNLEDAFLAARALSRAGKDREAIAAYQRFARTHRDHPRAAEAAYLAAWLSVREGLPEAHRALEAFLAGPFARRSPGRVADAERLLAYDAFDHARYREALAHLVRYGSLERGVETEVRYFSARVRERLGERDAAIATYLALARETPHAWYGLLSMKRLAALGTRVEPPRLAWPEAAAVDVRLPEAVAFLASIGLSDEAATLLRAHESEVRAAAPAGREREWLVAAYVELGDHGRAFGLARAAGIDLDAEPSEADAWARRALYPRPYDGEVRAFASRFGVDTSYVYATMRQESAFDPSAQSRAGAIGLLQLMPGTARSVATRMGVEFDRTMLFDPLWNVRLGIGEMGGLAERFHDLPAIVAAYNAGAGRVRAWLASARTRELDRWVEEIPYEETRRYVKRVMSHHAVYQALAGEPSKGLGALPDTLSFGD